MKLMIVDDSSIMRRAIGKYLTPLELELVATASNGQEAIDQFKATQPDLVTLDITMPQMDGLTCLTQLLALRPSIKVIVISALSDPATGLKALKLGAKSFLPKPFTEAQLVDEIRRVGGVAP
jgi:two-component system, chemotaxis family, chemotaxis protein CheY